MAGWAFNSVVPVFGLPGSCGDGSSHAGAALRSVPGAQLAPGQRDAVYLPPGWPEQVQPPGESGWEKSATAFLLDCCPADYRAHKVLHQHPVVLARFAADFVEGQIRSSREALAQSRASLRDYVTPQVLEAATELLQAEEGRLVRVRRGVALVEEALRGKVFLRKL